jgi:glutamine cyclotransferase
MKKVFYSFFALATLLTSVNLHAQEVCSDFRTFYMDHGPGVNGSNLYAVDLSGIDASVTLLESFNSEIHFAYGDVNNLLYLVNPNGSSVDVYDVDLGAVTNNISLQSGLSQLFAVVYNPNDSLLYVGSSNQNKIFAIDLSDGSYNFVADAPIEGGDLVLKGESLYVFTRTNDQLLKVVGNSTELVGTIPANVNGAAATEDGNFIIANFQAGVFSIIDENANLLEEKAIFDGDNAFTTSNGDMASGCRAFEPIFDPGECTSYKVYYINIPIVQGPSTLYEVEIDGSAANLTAIETFETSAHMGLNEDGLLYVVIGTGKLLIYDPSTGIASDAVQITLEGQPLNNIPHVVVDQTDGTLYVASADNNAVYSVNPLTAEASLVAALDLDIVGGDLVVTEDGTLWLVNRFDNTFYNITDGGTIGFSVALNSVNGAAILDDGTIIVANAGSSAFNLIDPSTGSLLEATLQTDLLFGNGDLAAGCVSREPIIDGCNNLTTYYYNYLNTANSGQLFKVDLSNSGAVYTPLAGFALDGNHIALDDNGLIYSVRESNIDIYDPIAQAYVEQNLPIKSLTGQSLSGFPAAVIDGDGTLWLGRGTNNTVYSIEFIDGEAIATAQFTSANGIMVDGGDLVVTESELGEEILWLANRTNNRLYNLTEGGFIMMPLSQVNGVSVLADNTLLLANGENNANGGLYSWNPSTGDLLQLENENGPVSFINGDLASRCLSGTPGTENPEPGDCYASMLVEYIQGTQNDGSALNGNRTDATKALFAPERTDAMVFVTLGYGGSVTFGFNGAVANLDGPDLEIVETSFGNAGCAAYPEYADVYVSVDGDQYEFASTVCKSNPFVDISDAGAFEYVMFVKIVNNDTLSSTIDSFDLDGVVAIHNCDENPTTGEAPQPALQSQLTETTARIATMPNPTSSTTQVVFSTENESRTTVEIIDLSGRVVETLFNQVANAGQVYRTDFNAANLTNGIYIARMVSGNEVVITKIMVSK